MRGDSVVTASIPKAAASAAQFLFAYGTRIR